MTLEEITTALADQALLTGVVSELKTKGYSIRNSDEEKLFLENYEKNVLPSKVESEVETRIKARVSELASGVEKDIFEVSGIVKEPNEKYYEYTKRVLNTLKETKGSDTENLLKDRLKLYEEKANELEQKLATEQESKKTEILGFKKKTLIDSALKEINVAYPSHITTDEQKQEYKKSIERLVLNDFETRFMAKDNNGDVVFYEGESPLLDTSTNTYLKPNEIISKNYSHFVAPKEQPKGGLGGEPQKPSNLGKMTEEQFDSYASEKGYMLGSKEYSTAYFENVGTI
jgi:hypothetical protein